MVAYYNHFSENYLREDTRGLVAQTSSYFAAAIASRYLEKRITPKQSLLQHGCMMKCRLPWIYVQQDRAGSFKNNTGLTLADSLMRVALAGVDYELAHPEKFKAQGSTLSEWRDGINSYYYSSLADTYGKILAQKGSRQLL